MLMSTRVVPYLCHRIVFYFRVLTLCLYVAGKEYCYLESFQASCSADGVILLMDAVYGRLHIGQCMKQHHSLCSLDVLRHVDTQCSGRQNCTFAVTSLDDLEHGCPSDVKPYLNATYACVTVSGPPTCPQAANGSRTAPLETRSGYLMPRHEPNAPGTASCPWRVALNGRRIQLTVIDFSLPTNSVECPVDVVINADASSQRTFSLCNDNDIREWMINTFDAIAFTAHLVFNTNFTTTKSHFLLHYEVTGCANIPKPEHTSLTRTGNKITIYCNSTGDTWFMNCVGNQWRGVIGNCSDKVISNENSEPTTNMPQTTSKAETNQKAVAIGVPAGIALGLLLLLFVIFLMKCYHRRSKASRNYLSSIEIPYRPENEPGNKTIQPQTSISSAEEQQWPGVSRSQSAEPLAPAYATSTLATVHQNPHMLPDYTDYQALAKLAYIRRSRPPSEHIYDTLSGESLDQLSMEKY